MYNNYVHTTLYVGVGVNVCMYAFTHISCCMLGCVCVPTYTKWTNAGLYLQTYMQVVFICMFL